MNTCKNKQESCGNAWSKGTTRDISSYKHKRKLRLDLREGKWRDMKWVHDTPYIADDGSGRESSPSMVILVSEDMVSTIENQIIANRLELNAMKTQVMCLRTKQTR